MAKRSSPPLWVPILTLASIAVFNLDAMFGQFFRTGAVAYVHPLPKYLPGSDNLVVKRYLGIPRHDWLVALSNVMFTAVLDGKRPEVALYGLQFAGQLVPMMMILIIEGNKRVGGGNWGVLRW
jgi:hypothetical protein